MNNSTTSATHVGLDVHKDTIAVAILRPGREAVDEQSVLNRPEVARRPKVARKLVSSWQRLATFRVCYGAGPTGCELQRQLAGLEASCQVVASTLVPRRPGVVHKDRSLGCT